VSKYWDRFWSWYSKTWDAAWERSFPVKVLTLGFLITSFLVAALLLVILTLFISVAMYKLIGAWALLILAVPFFGLAAVFFNWLD
jgi:hypothetical protein